MRSTQSWHSFCWKDLFCKRPQDFLAACMVYVCVVLPMSAEVRTGFVTKVNSPDSFEVGSMPVTITAQTACSLDVTTIPKNRTNLHSCDTQSIYVGSWVYLDGVFTADHRFVPAQLLTLVVDPLRIINILPIFNFTPPKGILNRDSLSLEKPEHVLPAKGQEYLWWLDGYPMLLNSATQLFSSPESELATNDKHLDYNMKPPHMNHFREDVHPLASPSVLGPDMWVLYHYNSVDASENKGLATRIRVWPDTVTEDEKAYLALFDAAVTPPDYANTKPGCIQFHEGPPISIVPDKKLQDEASRLGETLIPAYQRGLSSTEIGRAHV